MNNDLNLMLAQMLNKQQVEQATNERLIKEVQASEPVSKPEYNQE